MDEEIYELEQQEIQRHLSLLEEQRMENHKMWDSQILALSTLALGFSLIFLKDIINFDLAKFIILIKLSWFLFWATIVCTVSSFYVAEVAQVKWKDVLVKIGRHNASLRVSIYKLNKLLEQIRMSDDINHFKAERENGMQEIATIIENHDSSLKPLNLNHGNWNKAIEWLNIIRTLTFILAITLLTLFVYVNI